MLFICVVFYPQGANSYGQLGLGHKEDVLLPQQLSDFCEPRCIKSVTGGGGHSAAVTGSSPHKRMATRFCVEVFSPWVLPCPLLVFCLSQRAAFVFVNEPKNH